MQVNRRFARPAYLTETTKPTMSLGIQRPMGSKVRLAVSELAELPPVMRSDGVATPPSKGDLRSFRPLILGGKNHG